MKMSAKLGPIALGTLFLAASFLTFVSGQGQFAPGELLVKLEPGTSAEALTGINSSLGGRIINRFEQIRWYHLSFSGPVDLQSVMLEYSDLPFVEEVDRNWIVKLSATPNDPEFSPEQWNLHNTGQNNGTSDVDLDAPEAWDLETGNSPIIAFIDTGIDVNHQDLSANIWVNFQEVPGNGVDDDGNGFIDDRNGWNFNSYVSPANPGNNNLAPFGNVDHGTATSAIAAAIGNNSLGIAGVAWNARVMVLKTFGQLATTQARLTAAMQYARANSAKIVNNSWNSTDPLAMVRDEIAAAAADGVLFVFSAGNGGEDGNGNAVGVNIDQPDPAINSPTLYPCAYELENMICVAALDRNGDRPNFSNYGRRAVHLSAPGSEITSALLNNQYGLVPSTLGQGNGTSFAAPHVSGVLALVMSENPGYDSRELKEAVLMTAQPVASGATANLSHTGGLVNARLALRAYADSFDDGANLDLFFDESSVTGGRWGVGDQSGGEICDVNVQTVPATIDRVAAIEFNGQAGTGGSNWTLGVYKAAYPPGNLPQTLLARLTTDDGFDFSGRRGRFGLGIVGETGRTNGVFCTGAQRHTRIQFTASIMAGLDFTAGSTAGRAVPFITFNPAYSDHVFPEITVAGRTRLSFAVRVNSAGISVTISDSSNGQQLFQTVDYPYPSGFGFSGTFRPAFLYYGVAGDGAVQETLYLRNFASVR